MSAELFAELVTEFSTEPDVTLPGSGRGFGSSALKVGGSIFAMLSRDRLVIKLPASRVAALIESGEGEPFDAGKGKPMKEWVAVPETNPATWRALAAEALKFVRN